MDKVVSGFVNVTIQGRVATVELNRPEALNALNKEVIRCLTVKLKEISISDEIDIVVLSGAGRVFSAGGDIKTMLADFNDNEFFLIMDSINELIITLYCLPKLTISAISGAAAGLGLSLALATDYILAESSSKIAMNFIKIGLIPDGGAHFFLEKLVGEAKAKQIIWKGKTMSAEEAKEIGIINEVVEKELHTALDKKLDEWLHEPIQTMIKTKKIYAENNRPQLLKLLELEKHGQLKMRETMDHREGIKAFLQKRPPNFIGK